MYIWSSKKSSSSATSAYPISLVSGEKQVRPSLEDVNGKMLEE
jgi:hypothetical protein